MRKLFFLLFLIPTLGFADEFRIPDFSGGMWSYPSSNKIPDNSATYIQNFVTDVEPMAQERNGYARRDNTILGGTKSALGLWQFLDTSGNDWIITYSSRTFYKNTIGGTPTAFGLIATVDQIPDCAKNLGRIWCVDGTDSLWWFDGASTGVVSSAPLGTLIEPWRTRLVIANVTGAKSTVRVSADGDGTNWTIGGLATDPFAFQIGGANDGEYVRCLTGSYLDTMIIGRKYDLWGMDGFSQSDYVVRNISDQVGCIEPRTLKEVDGELVWLSARGLESMNGRQIRNISEPIRNITDVIVKNTVNQRSNTQTTQADFNAGTISPTGNLSTSILPGSVSIATMTATSFMDTVSTEFAAGTLTNLSASNDALVLSTTGFSSSYLPSSGGSDVTGCAAPYYAFSQQFLSTSTFALTSVTVGLSKQGSPGDYNLQITTDTANEPGTLLGTTAVLASGVSGSVTSLTYTFSPAISLSAGTTYWLQLVPTGLCSTPNRLIASDQNIAGPFSYYFGNDVVSSKSLLIHIYCIFTGISYASSGNIVSRNFDLGFTTSTWLWNWGALTSTKQIPTGSTITFQTQSSADGISFDPLVPVADNAITTSTVRRYLRYKATFTPNNISTSPTLSDITLNAGPFVSSTGIFTSQLFSVGSLITSWGPTSISDNHSSGTITYQFGSTNTASISAISNWTNILNGGVPTVSTNPYAAFRSTFVAVAGGVDLSLQEFQTSWNEGGVIPAPVATTYDRRYWISYTTSAATSPQLDSILIWQRNKSFTLFKGLYAGSFALWKDNLYFGNSNATGYVYKFDTGDTDDGATITSSLITKSFDLGQFYRDKEFSKAYVGYFGGSDQSGSFSISYNINRYGTIYSLGSANLTDEIGQNAAKFWFPLNQLVRGREIQYTISKSGSGSRLKLYDLATQYELKEEK